MKKIISYILVVAMLLTLVPSVFAAADYDYTISFDKTAYTAAPGETVSLKLLVTNNIAGKAETSVGMCQIRNNIPSGLTASVSDGLVNSDDVTVGKVIDYLTYTPVTFTDEAALYTINYKIPSTAAKGTTYTVNFDSNYTFLIDSNDDQIKSVETKGATITVAIPEPPANDYTISFDKTAYTAAPGETVSLKLLVTNNIAGKAQTSVGMCQIRNNIPSGLTASVSDGSIKADDVTVGKVIDYLTYTPVTFTDEAALYTINYKIPSTAAKGTTYTVNFDSNYTFLIDSNDDQIKSVETKGATITVAEGEAPVINRSLTVMPETMKLTWAQQADKAAAVKGMITSAMYKVTNASDVDVKADVKVSVSGNTAIVSYEYESGKTVTDTIALTFETRVLSKITVSKSALTVPVANQGNIAAYIKANVVVKADYADGNPEVIPASDYTVNVASDNSKATITYSGKTAEITLTLEQGEAPVFAHSLEVNPDTMYISLSEKANGVENTVKTKMASAIYKATAEDAGIDVKASVNVSISGSTATISFEYESGKTVTDTISLTYETSGGGGGGGGGGGAAGFDDKLVVTPGNNDNDNDDKKVFSDIKTDHFAYESIKSLYEKGIISGDGTNKVRPEDGITREETAKLALAINDIAIEKGAVINTTDAHIVSNWAKDIVATAANKGILKGYTDGTIRPLNTVTRGEMVAIIIRSLGVNTDDTATSFSDVPEDLWSAKYISAASQLGFVNGYTNGTFKPDQNITRAEAFVIYHRVLKFRETLISADN